ncbi:MAG TPA: MurR/RpiR family transcriptional regulator [Candidatus Cloacimonetes bacterium]|nr:MurR/RpiR family transcriptional regulator [Candidatus Cloacimonadota bacterium]HEX38191.1 MurR/RpiR family transcriptional regulator [Candidatus Cloacimonadota bacterium]
MRKGFCNMKTTLTEKLKDIPLSRQERVIADTITKNLQRNAFLNGPQIAALCDVAPSTITRFAQKLGYSGFPELKKELEIIYRKTTTPHEVFREFLNGNDEKDVVDTTIEQDIQNIMNLRTQLDRKTLEKVVEAIDNAKKILIASIGASETCVDIFYYYLDALGKEYIKLKGFGISKQIEIMEIEPNDVVIAISFQRILLEVRDVAQFAKNRGATTIAITDSEFNALARVCNHILIAPVTATVYSLSQAAPVVMVNLIVNSLAALNKDKSLKMLEKTKKEWEEFPIFCE